MKPHNTTASLLMLDTELLILLVNTCWCNVIAQKKCKFTKIAFLFFSFISNSDQMTYQQPSLQVTWLPQKIRTGLWKTVKTWSTRQQHDKKQNSWLHKGIHFHVWAFFSHADFRNGVRFTDHTTLPLSVQSQHPQLSYVPTLCLSKKRKYFITHTKLRSSKCLFYLGWGQGGEGIQLCTLSFRLYIETCWQPVNCWKSILGYALHCKFLLVWFIQKLAIFQKIKSSKMCNEFYCHSI